MKDTNNFAQYFLFARVVSGAGDYLEPHFGMFDGFAAKFTRDEIN